MSKIKSDLRLINENGEVFYRRTSNSFSRWDDEKGYKFYHNRASINGMVQLKFPEDLPDVDLARITRLSRFLVPNQNVLAYKGNGNKLRLITPERMARILRTSTRSIYRTLDSAREFKIIRKLETENGDIMYCMNPLYFSAGNYIPLQIYILFRDEIDKYLPGWAIDQYRLQELQSDVDDEDEPTE